MPGSSLDRIIDFVQEGSQIVVGSLRELGAASDADQRIEAEIFKIGVGTASQ